MQLTIFMCCECYRTRCKSCNSLYIRCNSLQFNYNFIITIPFQLLYNSLISIIIMSCWCYFSSIHQNLTCGTMRIFVIFLKHWYPSSIMIICFKWFWIMTHGTIKSCHLTLIEIWKYNYIYIGQYIAIGR